MKKRFTFLAVFMLSVLLVFAQSETNDSNGEKKVKKGFSVGGIPVVAFNSDLGFQYGLVLNLYHYGDGTRYPFYDHSLYLEWSQTTKGGGRYQVIYDSDRLIPKTRVTFEAGLFTEKALDFYGFNGYNADYNPNFADDTNDDYLTRVFYRHDRKMFRVKADFQGNLRGKELKWLFGFANYKVDIKTVDIEKLNEDKEGDDILPDVPTLYDQYVNWGVIKADQKDGGNVAFFKAGVVYDTRDNEPNPNSGIWSEALLQYAPFGDYTYSKLLLTHRQYFTLVKNRLTFAYRLSYQAKLSGEIPFYMLPFFVDSKQTQDGLGGAKNLRGIMRNRVTGDGIAMGNLEFRWKFLRTVIFNQNFYIALNTFLDGGMVTSQYKFSTEGVTAGFGNTKEQNLAMLNTADEGLHLTYGAGLRFALNDNFIIAVDYGMAANKQDGESGLYIGLNYIF